MLRSILIVIATIIVVVVALAMSLDVGFKDAKVQRIWSWFACGLLGLFVVWMIVLVAFLK